MADVLEFWKQKGIIYVEFNSKCYTFGEFLKLQQSRKIIELMYNKIISDFPGEVRDKTKIGEVVGKFIKNHFLKKDKIFDVIIYNEGQVVKFNMEE